MTQSTLAAWMAQNPPDGKFEEYQRTEVPKAPHTKIAVVISKLRGDTGYGLSYQEYVQPNPDVDCKEFADAFFDAIGDELSLRELYALADKFKQEADKWEAERQALIMQSEATKPAGT